MTAFTIAFRAGQTGQNAGIIQDNADAGTWTGGALNTDSEIQGTGCSGSKVSNATVHFYHTGTVRDFIGGANDGDHVYTWANCLTPNLDTIANGGIRIRIGQTATNYRDFYVGGDGTGADDPYAGGWKNFVVDPTLAADSVRIFDVSTPDMNIADVYGGVIKTIAMISGNFDNGLFDQIAIGTGLRIIAGDGADPAGTFADFISEDEGTKANKYGVCRNVGGVNLFQGKIFFGDGTTTTEFEDTNAIVVFEEANVSTDHYELYVNTDATVTFGNLTSGVTSGGCFFDSENTDHAYDITVVEGGTVEAVLNAYATTFNEFRTASLNPSTTMIDSTLSGGGQIALNGATLTGCGIISSTVGANTGALLVDSVTEWNGGGTAIVSDTFFGDNAANANSGAIEITAASATAYDFDNITFSGNSYDVINSSGGAITINVAGGDTPTVLNLTTSTTTVVNAVTLTLTNIETDSEVRIINLEDVTNFNRELAGVEATSGELITVDIIGGGSGYTNGAQTLTVVGGTGTAAQFTVNVVGGVVDSVTAITVPGDYTVNPVTNPATTTGGGGTGATFNLRIAGEFSYNYDAGLGVRVAIIVFHIDFIEVRIEQLIPAVNSSIPIQQRGDRVYST